MQYIGKQISKRKLAIKSHSILQLHSDFQSSQIPGPKNSCKPVNERLQQDIKNAKKYSSKILPGKLVHGTIYEQTKPASPGF